MASPRKALCGWQTIAVVGYSGPVARPGRENPAAHGGVTLRQTRVRAWATAWGRREVQAREVNVNGRHVEVGPAYHPSAFRWSAKEGGKP